MVHVAILAAGKGTRMKSELPKVLHPVKGTPIIERLLKTVVQVDPKPSLIVGYKAEEVIAGTANKYDYVVQKEQLGTGHAIKVLCDEYKGKDISTLVVLPGDMPLITKETIEKLIEIHSTSDAAVTLGTVKIEEGDPRLMIFNNFGRIIRNAEGKVDSIVEYKDATEEQRAVKEFNLSYYAFDFKWLCDNISKLGDNNAAKEFYLTDMIHIAIEQGRHVDSYIITNVTECLGINSPEQLKMVEDALDE